MRFILGRSAPVAATGIENEMGAVLLALALVPRPLAAIL